MIQSVADAFKMVAEELEKITHDYDGMTFDSQIEHAVRSRLRSLEHKLQANRLIRGELTFYLEARSRIIVHVPPEALLAACRGQLFGM
jgi:hypothetical protein